MNFPEGTIPTVHHQIYLYLQELNPPIKPEIEENHICIKKIVEKQHLEPGIGI